MKNVNKTWGGNVKEGKFIPYDEGFEIAYHCHEGKRIEVEIRRYSKKRKRSVLENNYMWGVVYKTIGDHLGYTPEEIHTILRLKFWYEDIDDMKFPKSTQAMSTTEMELYLSQCRSWASDYDNLWIPKPNEV